MDDNDPLELPPDGGPPGLRRVVALVAGLNLGYFFVEFAVALAIGSVSLFADSVDFLEDTSINLLILLALGWPARARAGVGTLLAGVLLVPTLATLWTAWDKIGAPTPPSPTPLALTGLGALVVNMSCALMLTRSRHPGKPHQGGIPIRPGTMPSPISRSSRQDL